MRKKCHSCLFAKDLFAYNCYNIYLFSNSTTVYGKPCFDKASLSYRFWALPQNPHCARSVILACSLKTCSRTIVTISICFPILLLYTVNHVLIKLLRMDLDQVVPYSKHQLPSSVLGASS